MGGSVGLIGLNQTYSVELVAEANVIIVIIAETEVILLVAEGYVEIDLIASAVIVDCIMQREGLIELRYLVAETQFVLIRLDSHVSEALVPEA